MNSKPGFWEFTKKSARDATREYFRPLNALNEQRDERSPSKVENKEPQESKPVQSYSGPQEPKHIQFFNTSHESGKSQEPDRMIEDMLGRDMVILGHDNRGEWDAKQRDPGVSQGGSGGVYLAQQDVQEVVDLLKRIQR